MEFEYRLLSEERCKEIDSLNIMDPYGDGKRLSTRGFYWVSNADESILFFRAFSPRHDNLEGNRTAFLFFNRNEYHFIYYDLIDVKDFVVNELEYRYLNINILESEYIENCAEKHSLLFLLKELISVCEKNRIRSRNFCKEYVMEFEYKGEMIK